MANDTVDSSIHSEQAIVKNGRLYFSSKESFAKVYKNYANASEDKLLEYFQPLYEQGFYSLRPIVNEKNENFLYDHYLKLIRTNRQGKGENLRAIDDQNLFDYLDDLEEIIGDDAFAAFLNNDAEILVGNKVYKYSDVGLFISREDKLIEMENYLDIHNISKDLTVPTTLEAQTQFYQSVPCGGMEMPVPLISDVEYYVNIPCPPIGVGPVTGPYNPTPGSVTVADPNYSTFVNSLNNCTPHSGLFGNLFGDNNVCIDKYEDKRRVKTKAFNYNYLLVYHLGVKCVHQFKGWTGFWRVEAADEIRLVVEAAQFQYDLDALLGNTAVNNQTKERIYFMNNQKAVFTGPNTITFNNQWGAPIISYQNLNQLPTIFRDDLSFEFFGTGWDLLDNTIQNGIDSNLKASALNNYFYNALYSTATSQLQTAFGNSTSTSPNRTFVAKFPEQGKLIFQKSVFRQGFGNGVAEKTFDWGAEFSFNASTSGEDGWNISGGGGSVLVRPKNYRVKIVGAARKGGNWHGSKFNVGIN